MKKIYFLVIETPLDCSHSKRAAFGCNANNCHISKSHKYCCYCILIAHEVSSHSKTGENECDATISNKNNIHLQQNAGEFDLLVEKIFFFSSLSFHIYSKLNQMFESFGRKHLSSMRTWVWLDIQFYFPVFAWEMLLNWLWIWLYQHWKWEESPPFGMWVLMQVEHFLNFSK